MLKNKLFRVIALVATVCCLGGAVTGLTLVAVNSSASEAAAASPEHIIQVKQPENVTFYVAASGANTKTFKAIADGQGSLTEANKGATAITKIERESMFVSEGETVFNVTLDVEGDYDGDGTFCTFWYKCSDIGSTANFTFPNGSVVQGLPSTKGLIEVTATYEADWPDDTKPVLSCAVVKTTYSVSANVTNCTVNTKNNDSILPANANEAYQFVVTPDAGYQVAGVTYNVLSTPASTGTCMLQEGGYYEIPAEQVKGPIVITVSTTEVVYNVIGLGDQSDYVVSGQATVKHGSTYEFGVEVTNPAKAIKSVKYSMGDVRNKELVTNGQSGSNETYKIPNVTADITIAVTVEDVTYSVTFPSDQPGYKITKVEDADDATELSGHVSVGYGALKFKVVVQPGYTGIPTVTFIPTSGQAVPISPEQDVYTLSVSSNGTINVTGITQATYTVTVNYDSLTHYDYTSAMSNKNLTYGEEFIFTVTAQDGYQGDGYEVQLSDNDSESTISPDNPTDKAVNNFTVTVNGNVTVTLTEKQNSIKSYQVSYSDLIHSNYRIQVKTDSGDGWKDLGSDTKVEHGKPLHFKVITEGYRVVSLAPTSAHLTNEAEREYTIESVTGNVQIRVTLTENVLTIKYLNAAGTQNGADTTFKYSDLTDDKKETLLRSENEIDSKTYTYLNKEWYKDSAKVNKENIVNSAKEATKNGDATWTLRLHYTVNTEKAKELLYTFYAYYRNDDPVGNSADKSYFIYRMEINGENWKSFLNELDTIGNGSLSAVGFAYTNSSQLSKHGIADYTTSDIEEYYGSMQSATEKAMGKVKDADRLCDDNSGAQLWLFGYKWDTTGGNQENQVQFIKGVKSGAVRHFCGWFMVSLYGETTVIKGDYVTTDTNWTTKGPKSQVEQQEVALVESQSISDVGYEGPTIE